MGIDNNHRQTGAVKGAGVGMQLGSRIPGAGAKKVASAAGATIGGLLGGAAGGLRDLFELGSSKLKQK